MFLLKLAEGSAALGIQRQFSDYPHCFLSCWFIKKDFSRASRGLLFQPRSTFYRYNESDSLKARHRCINSTLIRDFSITSQWICFLLVFLPMEKITQNEITITMKHFMLFNV